MFVGGRDDPFFSDIGGFFRSINFKAALTANDEFTWKGEIGFSQKRWEKEQFGRRKRLLDRAEKRGVYDGSDLRLGNNINALVFQIPISMIVTDPGNERLVYTWAESYLTAEAYWHINKQNYSED